MVIGSQFIKSVYTGIIEKNARILEPTEENGWEKRHELDIYLPELHLGIEFNGDYFHDYEKFPEVKKNDDFKKIACESQGIKLITVWEHEWDDSRISIENSLKQEFQNA